MVHRFSCLYGPTVGGITRASYLVDFMWTRVDASVHPRSRWPLRRTAGCFGPWNSGDRV